ncbi:MAG: hypothetical protein MUC94_09650 [bacterium]|jgi:hypothetical protein|nr:hypothetical protein [bacterium]
MSRQIIFAGNNFLPNPLLFPLPPLKPQKKRHAFQKHREANHPPDSHNAEI